MGNKVVPVRLEDDIITLIDELIELGVFKTRSEALRALIKEGAKKMSWLNEISEAVKKLFELEKNEGEIPIKLEGGLEELLSGRGRF
ncbi:MAG: ribbon-helix-helix domain-containing protein [Desulfurococcales archaeon]|nr:ribbon-helix-helix domain-containing protein [Desulfurococcales archaeon]